jgi:hypothetical protein
MGLRPMLVYVAPLALMVRQVGLGVVGQGGADFVDVGAVAADGLVEDLAGDVEFFRPVGDVGGDFGVDLFGIAGALGVLFVGGVGLVGFGCVVVLGHAGFLFPGGSG